MILVLGDSCQATPECTGTDNTVCTNGKCDCADGFQQQGDACAPGLLNEKDLSR